MTQFSIKERFLNKIFIQISHLLSWVLGAQLLWMGSCYCELLFSFSGQRHCLLIGLRPEPPGGSGMDRGILDLSCVGPGDGQLICAQRSTQMPLTTFFYPDPRWVSPDYKTVSKRLLTTYQRNGYCFQVLVSIRNLLFQRRENSTNFFFYPREKNNNSSQNLFSYLVLLW